jgi:hypothetical protein
MCCVLLAFNPQKNYFPDCSLNYRAGQVFAGRDRGDEKGEGKISRESAGLPSDGMLMCNFNQVARMDPLRVISALLSTPITPVVY